MEGETWDWKRFLLDHISTVLLVVLGIEMLFLIVLIVFEYLEFSPDDYFYLFSLIILMVSTTYFGWHCLVKENAFELIAFLVMSSLLTFHGLYKVLSEPTFFAIDLSAICVLSVSQLIYYGLFYYAYRHFGWRMVAELHTTDQNVVQAFKLFETFVSVMKIDFMLYTITVATFWFYLFVYWSSSLVVWISVSAFVYVCMIAFSLIGTRAAFQEKNIPMTIFLWVNPLLSLFKAAIIVIVITSPGSKVTTFVLVQSILIAAIDIIIAIVVGVLGAKLRRNFSRGLLTLINTIDKSLLVKPII
mmetsp:Transcript_26001/g.46013  ORF Transcript_26001/g.46013 Transcript_26001/m.46013 type:complete len:301 (+) Transcript_26001:1211-2113(+)